MPEKPRKRVRAGTDPWEDRVAKAAGLQGGAQAFDYFSNIPARMGYGSPSLAEGATYELNRLSFDYWLLITLYRNHWITRRIVDTPARDMVRAWPTLTSEISPDDIAKLDKKIRRTQTKNRIRLSIEWARLFGGAGALIVIDGQEDDLEKPLELDSIEIGAFKGLIPFDRWSGIYPEGNVCNDINRPTDFNKPEMYQVQVPDGEAFQVHSSRILRFCGPEVPTPEYQAQTWWGISVIEPAYEEIKKRDNMSWNILSLTFRACILGMKFPELAKILSGVGINQNAARQFQERMTELNHLISNQSMIPLPADGGIESTNYTFSGLSDCYQQFQLDISGATQIPVTRLWGRTISGLGQSNDADERIYEERIATDQDNDLRPQLEKLFPVLCMSELGEIPDDLDLNFPSVRVLDEKEKSDLAKATVDTVVVALNSGLISPQAAAKELKQASPSTGLFSNLTDAAIAKLSDEIQQTGEMDPDMAGLFGPEKQEKKAEGAVARATDSGDWNESDVDRDDEGKFAGGGASGSKTDHLTAYKSRDQWPEHAKKLAIPPAWKDVKISSNPSADLLATGKDAKGRPQYVYSQKFKDSQAALKFERVDALRKEMPMIDNELAAMRKSKDPKTKDHADCMTLIRHMGIRPGSDSDTKAKVKAYGASTLQGHHVWELGNVTRLRFVGKKGVTISLPVSDPSLSDMLRKRKKQAGGNGKLFPTVSDASLLDFSHENLDHGGFKTKDFRTHLATTEAEQMVSKTKPPANEKEYKKKVKEVAKHVAEKLGNTPIVALQSYISPQIWGGWRASIGI